MTKSRITVVDATLRSSADGSVHGQIFLEAGDVRFPDGQWDDFVVVVLGWWSRAIRQCLSGDHRSVTVHFMDGPFLVELCSVSSDTVRLDLIEDGLTRRVVRRGDVEVKYFAESLLATSEQVLCRCRERGWTSADTDELESELTGLRRALWRVVK